MNIRKMSPEQIDALIHTRVMKQSLEPCPGDNCSWDWDNKAHCLDCGAYNRSSDADDLMHTTKHIPRYSKSLDAAWLVVKRFTVRVEIWYSYDVTCKIGAVIGEPSYGIDKEPAMAVCMAALKALGVIAFNGELIEEGKHVDNA